MAAREPIRIDDPADPRVLAYADVRDRDLKGREGAFVAEGEVVLRVLFAPSQARFRPRSVLVSDKYETRIRALVEASAFAQTPIYVMSPSAMDRLVGFPIHRGILALVDRGEPLSAHTLCAPPGARLVVALLGVVNHDNVGSIMRSAAAFGADGVLLDHVSCDPLYRKSIRVSVGGALVVPFARAGSESEVVDTLAHAGYSLLALTPRGESEISMIGDKPPLRRALLLGTEGTGLSESILSRCERVRIAMAGQMDSLNVSVACGIALHALTHRK